MVSTNHFGPLMVEDTSFTPKVIGWQDLLGLYDRYRTKPAISRSSTLNQSACNQICIQLIFIWPPTDGAGPYVAFKRYWFAYRQRDRKSLPLTSQHGCACFTLPFLSSNDLGHCMANASWHFRHAIIPLKFPYQGKPAFLPGIRQRGVQPHSI